MPIFCLIGFHKWQGCKCAACAAARDEQHDWGKDCGECSRCGATRQNAHEWQGCKCSACGAGRDEQHDWNKDCEKCARCGTTRLNAHDWNKDCEKCARCFTKRLNAHKWNDCKCSVCGQPSGEGHRWAEEGTCVICGVTKSLALSRDLRRAAIFSVKKSMLIDALAVKLTGAFPSPLKPLDVPEKSWRASLEPVAARWGLSVDELLPTAKSALDDNYSDIVSEAESEFFGAISEAATTREGKP